MANVKSAQAIAEKWARVTPQRAEDYRQGIAQPRRPWAAATAGAAQTWQTAVTQAATSGRFAAGVQRAGDQKWQQKAQQLGANRFSEGVAAAGSDYQQGFDKYRQVIESTQLPPRFPKGDPRNLQRVQTMAEALRRAKVGSAGR